MLAPRTCGLFQQCLISRLQQQPLFLQSLRNPILQHPYFQLLFPTARGTSPAGYPWGGDALCKPKRFPWGRSSLRPYAHAQPPTKTSCEPCNAAGRKTATCCVPTLLWLLTTTTHSRTGKESRGGSVGDQSINSPFAPAAPPAQGSLTSKVLLLFFPFQHAPVLLSSSLRSQISGRPAPSWLGSPASP